VLEVTDLDRRGRYTTPRFFDGSKPEYPRAMRCIQGSDAHRLVRESPQSKILGVGDRITEILLAEVSFAALAAVLKGNDFSLTRPYRGPATPLDFVQAAREEGPSLVLAFHGSLAQRGGALNRILEDICAMANTNGGTIYVGVSANSKEKPAGIREPQKAIEQLQSMISRHISPEPEVSMDSLLSQGQNVVRIAVPPGKEIPYAIDDNRFYVRTEAETSLAVRDEIVRLVERRILGESHLRAELAGQRQEQAAVPAAPAPPPGNGERQPARPAGQPAGSTIAPPRTGVEIVQSEARQGTIYHTVRDLRNGSLISNVTRSSARRLWHYAISQAEAGGPDLSHAQWQGSAAVLNERRKDNYTWYDLALRDGDGVHVYYGVTDSGLNDEWLAIIEGRNT
jgi:hypothetical protein